MSPHSAHPGHTFRCVLFLPFFCPVPALLLVCRHRCSSRNGTGHHSAASLTGSMCQPSWRVMHGSARRPDGQRFHSDGTVADVRSIFPLTRGQASRDLRCRALSDGMVVSAPSVTSCDGCPVWQQSRPSILNCAPKVRHQTKN